MFVLVTMLWLGEKTLIDQNLLKNESLSDKMICYV